MYLLKLAFRPWRVAPVSQIFTFCAVGLLLFICGFLFWMDRGLSSVMYQLKHEQVITVYVDPSVAQKDENSLVGSIKLSLGAKAEVKLTSPLQFVDNIKDRFPELAKELEELGTEISTVVPRYISAFGNFKSSALDEIKKINGVESVETSKDRYKHVIGAFGTLKWVARIVMLGLCLALLAGLVQLARMNAGLHSESLNLLKLWGAGFFTLKFPGIFSGFLIGVASGVIAFSLWFFGGIWQASHIKMLSPLFKIIPLPVGQIGIFLLLSGIVFGFFAGIVSCIRVKTAPSGGIS